MDIENLYKQQVSLEHRKKYCQFYTNNIIAKFMINWVMEYNPQYILDPAFGMGIFYFSAKDNNFKSKFKGYEIDINSFNFFKSNFNFDNLNLLNVNYFSEYENNIDSIICNPPYAKFQNFVNSKEILNDLSKKIGENLLGYTNISSAFLIKSVYELKERGRLAYIMPLEFLNTGYGRKVKQYLLKSGKIYNIIKINDEKNIFSEVTTTVGIILFEKTKSSTSVGFSSINNINDIFKINYPNVIIDNINPNDKWDSYFIGKKDVSNTNFIKLKTIGIFRRGIATGANEFFSLNKKDIIKLGLSDCEYTKCITKSNQIKTSIFTYKDFNNLSDSNANVYLFNVNSNMIISKSAEKYINYGKERDFDKRYLTRNRKCWFELEYRIPAPILFGVFSRGDFKIIRNKTNAVNLTCYHGFIPNNLDEKYIDRLFLFLKSDIGKKNLLLNKRIYGDGLNKFEPSDIGEVLIPKLSLLDQIDDIFVDREMNYLLKHNKVSDYCNEFFSQLLIK